MAVGFYGKLPSHGDFVSRSVNDVFVDRWDNWLQLSVARSRNDLGDAWLDLFLTSPVWRFALQGGFIGGAAWAGLLMPSVDRVGRYFPLTVVAELSPAIDPLLVSVAAAGWFDWVEAVARRALQQDILDLDALRAELGASEEMLVDERLVGGAVAAAAIGFPTSGALWRFNAGAGADVGRFYARLAGALTGDALAPLAIWWSAGSEHVDPSILMTRGLPPAEAFEDFLRGAWSGAWRQEVASPVDTVVRAMAPLRLFESVAVTDVGRERAENQDAYLERGSEGFWLVADGMGGHQAGAFASQLVAQCAMRADLSGELASMAYSAAKAFENANAQLRKRAATEPGFDAGSTVVALCLRDHEAIVQWAGDSRLYRLRDELLTQLTRDHTVTNDPEAHATDADAHIITRAVGGADILELDHLRFDVRGGDRFLLCSDGLYSDLTAEEIAHAMTEPKCAAVAATLLSMALARGGHDNATAVVVDVPPAA
jgi:type VI secretion system protein ImpM